MNRRDVIVGAAAVAVAAATAAAVGPGPWRVFRVSEYEWYVARSPLEALAAAAADWGCQDVPLDLGTLLELCDKEGLAADEPEALTDAELDRLKFVDVDECDVPDLDTRRTFREELAQRVAAGLDAPEHFAASEW